MKFDDSYNSEVSLSYIGQHPTGDSSAGGRQTAGRHCCCVRSNQNCPIPSGGSGSDIIDIIDPRLQGIGTRIVNNVS